MEEISLEDTYRIISLIEKDGNQSQRLLAESLGYSLGKVNYLLQSLAGKGFIKLENFVKSNNKMGYRYVLTPKGVNEKYLVTKEFLKRKESEYEKMRIEIEAMRREVTEFREVS